MRRSWIGLVVALGLAGDVSAQEPAQGIHRPAFDALCALGQTASAGCDAIRARDPVDASAAPWRSVGRVNYAGIDRRQHCTGTLISARHVLTAAHCLYDASRKIWLPANAIRFVAGYQRGSAMAQAGGRRYETLGGQVPGTREFGLTPEQDLAVIELDRPIGEETGFWTLANVETGTEVQLVGYTGLRPHILSRAEDCGRAQHLSDRATLLVHCSAMRGDSGGPIFTIEYSQPHLVAVFSSIVVTPDATNGRPPVGLAVPAQTVQSLLDRFEDPS